MATVWGWGDEFEDVRTNSEKYINKRWRGSTKECRIHLMAKERNEDISYDITAYTSDPKKVGDLTERLFYSALNEGDTKVDFIIIQLFDSIVSNKRIYRSSMEEVEVKLKDQERLIFNKFIEDPKVKSVAQDKNVVFIPQINLLCEMESEYANKIVIELVHHDFSCIKNLLHSLSNSLVEEGLAKRILGYELWRVIDDLKVWYVDVYQDEVHVWLV